MCAIFSQFSTASNSKSHRPHTFNVLNLPKSSQPSSHNSQFYLSHSVHTVLPWICIIQACGWVNPILYSSEAVIPARISLQAGPWTLSFCLGVFQSSIQRGHLYLEWSRSLVTQSLTWELLPHASRCHCHCLCLCLCLCIFSIIVFGFAFIIAFVTVES